MWSVELNSAVCLFIREYLQHHQARRRHWDVVSFLRCGDGVVVRRLVRRDWDWFSVAKSAVFTIILEILSDISQEKKKG